LLVLHQKNEKRILSVKVKVTIQNHTERILYMVTLKQKTLDINHKIKLSNDGGSLSSDTGEFLFREFDE